VVVLGGDKNIGIEGGNPIPRLFLKIFLWFWLTVWGIVAIVLLGNRLTGMRQVSPPNMYATVAPILASEAVDAYESGGPLAFARFSHSNVDDGERRLYLLDGFNRDVLSRSLSTDGLRVARAAKTGQVVVLRGHIAAYKYISPSGRPYILLLYIKSGLGEYEPHYWERTCRSLFLWSCSLPFYASGLHTT
jgi:hypothetical protein